MDENVAFQLEKDLISKYRKIGQCKCNIADGGEGSSFPRNSKNDLLRRLHLSEYCEKDYTELEKMTVEQLIEEDIERDFNKVSSHTFKLLDIYDDDGNLNLGWECFDD